MVDIMPNISRNVLYRHFGPRLFEAMMSLILDEINNLRANAGLPARTKQQVQNAIKTKLDDTPKYDWED